MSEVTIEKEAWEDVKMDIINLKNRVNHNEAGIKDFRKYKEKNGDRKHSWMLSILPVVVTVALSLFGGVTYLSNVKTDINSKTESLRLEIKGDMSEMKKDIKDFIITAVKK